jgi:predicted negative regulator of RcsB-dependent stress response
MDNKDAIVFSVLVIGILSLFGGVIGMNYWDAQQVRVMYQQAYAKNMDCRSDSKRSIYEIEKVCGSVPNFEDYQK